MNIIRWNPYREMETLRRQFDRLVNDVTDWTPLNTIASYPPIELINEETQLVLKAQLPGWNKEDLEITATRESVTLKGSVTKQKSDNLYYSEFQETSFERIIRLPVPVENEQVKAEYIDGILSLMLPKVATSVDRSVKVNLGQ